MSTTTTNDVKLTFKYEDDTSRTYTVPDVPSSILPNVANHVRALNASLQSADATTPGNAAYSVKHVFIGSDTEEISYLAKISGAKIVSKQEEIIYGN